MTPNQKALREIQDEIDGLETRSNEILSMETIDDDLDTELRELAGKKKRLLERRSAVRLLLDEDDKKSVVLDNGLDSEQRERMELRERVSLTNYLRAAMEGRQPDGAERELRDAAGVNGIPLELFDVPTPQEKRVATGAPGTVGVNLDRIRPAVFANSIAPRLGIEMPRVESGTYASATISTSLAAGSHAAGSDAAATAAAFTVTSVTPKRISARLEVRIEDVAAVGQENFESILRENLSLVLSDELDKQAINGAGGNSGADLLGMFNRLTDPTTAPSSVADFDFFAGQHASGIDGLWANDLKDVGIVVGPATMELAAKTFQSATNYKGEKSAAAYAMAETGGFWTNKRMPDAGTFLTVADVQQAILYRMGRSMEGGEGGMRTAVCAHWNEISIDDIYTGSASGTRNFTMHVLLSDVIIVQSDAYAQVAYKVA